MSPPDWDDDFDFDDEPKKKKTQTKKNNKNQDDFFDDDKTNKLPNINSKPAIEPVKQNKRNSAKINQYTDNIKPKSNIYDNDDDDVYQEIQDEPKIKNNVIHNKMKQPEPEIDYYEDIQQEPQKKQKKPQMKKIVQKQLPKQSPKKVIKKEQPEENYEDENFEDAYGQDFQQEIVQQATKSPQKKVKSSYLDYSRKPVKQTPTQTSNQKKPAVPPKPPSRAADQSKQRNLTMDKNIHKVQIPRSQSRNSIRSVQSKRGGTASRKISTNMSFVPNKYTSQINRSFPDINLSELNLDKMNKLNQRLRAMIKKFNDELNDLINKNMMYLKSKKNQKIPNIDNKLKVLQQHSKNNETMIDIMEKEFDKLADRDGQLREQEYQLMTQRQIDQVKTSIKQLQKDIVKLKNQIKSQGNKLSNKGEDKKLSAQLHHLKTTLIQSKKDEEKQGEKVTKLEEQSKDLTMKISQIQYKLSELVDQAKEKGVQLESNQQLNKKFQNIKKKLQTNKNHKSKLENLLRTKSDIILHEKQQLRINVRNCELQIKNLYDSIDHAHNQSIKIVQKAKNNPKLNQNLISDLDSILKSLELVQHDNFSVRSEQNKSRASNRPLKNSVIGNMQKPQTHKRSESTNNDKHLIAISVTEDTSKPNLLKKKPKVNDMPEQKKIDAERIWRDEDKQKPKQQIKSKQKSPQKPAIVEQEKDKKKPFTLKKNRIGGQTTKTQQEKSQNQIKPEPTKLQIEEKKPQEQRKQQISIAAPRMMKFKRRNQENKESVPQKQEEKPVESKLTIQQQPKKDDDQPVFAPKRFNLRNRQQKKEDSYIPTGQTKQIKQQSVQVPVAEKKVQQYKPKFNFGQVQDNFKSKPLPNNHPQNKQTPIVVPGVNDKSEQDDKPKFNLRLRDRKKKQEDSSSGYMPSGTSEHKISEGKPVLQLGVKETTLTSVKQNPIQNNNGYLPKQNTTKENTFNLAAKNNPPHVNKQQPKVPVNNPYAPKQEPLSNNSNNPYIQPQTEVKKKEGPVKKPKVQPIAQKQKLNIYEQAEQAQGLNQFVHEPTKKQSENVYNPPAQNKDLDLNDLLGVNKKKNNDDLTDLIGGGGNNKKTKKNTDFFGDMEL